jgi:hypothetical protein
LLILLSSIPLTIIVLKNNIFNNSWGE